MQNGIFSLRYSNEFSQIRFKCNKKWNKINKIIDCSWLVFAVHNNNVKLCALHIYMEFKKRVMVFFFIFVSVSMSKVLTQNWLKIHMQNKENLKDI